MFIYSIYDKKAVFHRTTFFATDDASAVRTVGNAANDSRTDLCNYPDDFALYCIGEFDSHNGVVSGFTPIKFIVEVSSLIKIEKSDGSH